MVGGGKASCVFWSPICLVLLVHVVYIREMVSLIPRFSSFAVSGTPAKTGVSDLSYVLKLGIGRFFHVMLLTKL